MLQTTTNERNGIQWTLMEQLDDLDYADDIALLSHNHQQMEEKLSCLEERAAETGLIISTKQEAHGPHRSPEKTVQINTHI